MNVSGTSKSVIVQIDYGRDQVIHGVELIRTDDDYTNFFGKEGDWLCSISTRSVLSVKPLIPATEKK